MPVPEYKVELGPNWAKFEKSSEILIGRLGKTSQNPLLKEMDKVLKPLVPYIRARTPVATGKLRSTVTSRVRFTKRSGKVIGEVGYFFIGPNSNEYGRIVASRVFEKDRRTTRKAAKRIEPNLARDFTNAIIKEADKIIGVK